MMKYFRKIYFVISVYNEEKTLTNKIDYKKKVMEKKYDQKKMEESRDPALDYSIFSSIIPHYLWIKGWG